MPKIIEYTVIKFSGYEENNLVLDKINDGWFLYGGIIYTHTDGYMRQVMVKYDTDTENEHQEQLNALKIYTSDVEAQNAELRQLLSKRETELYDAQMESGMWKESTERAERWTRWCPPLFQVFCAVMMVTCLYIGIENNRAYFLSYLHKSYIIGR